MLLTLASFIVTIGVIIIIHEIGHFTAARLTGMRVKRFSIGFPPTAISRKIGETEFALSWIPLGGYVQIAGMVDESLEEGGVTGAPDEFMSKNVWQKVFVLAAGVLMNYFVAFLIIAGLTAATGIGELDGTTVGEALDGKPALNAGVRAGDKITSVNGIKTATWDDLIAAVSTAGDSISLTLDRAGEAIAFRFATDMSGDGSQRRMIGIAPKVNIRSASAGEIITRGGVFCWATTVGIIDFFRGLATGESSLSQLAGPLGVAKLSGESARQGSGAFLFFIAYVSVSIGFLNILPVPALDGGHIVYAIIEAIIRRPISTKVKLWMQQIGMALLLLLVVFVSYHDVLRIFSH
ncbi:RIP metalloprotease [candidate division KSB1 bacterium]|nr:MAG: RIP metalloprotease [candidate division KSB1 bacterium]